MSAAEKAADRIMAALIGVIGPCDPEPLRLLKEGITIIIQQEIANDTNMYN